MPPISRTVAVLMLLVCTALWGFAFVAQKWAMDSMGALTFGGVRYLIAGVVILPLALWEYRRRAQPISRANWRLIAVFSVVFFFGAYLQQWGLLTTSATNGGFLTGLYVLFVPVIAFLALRTRPHPILYLCVPLALLGLYYLNGGGFSSFNGGDGLVVMSAVFWAVHVLMLSFLGRSTGLPIFVSAVSFLVSGAIAMIAALVVESPTLEGIVQGWPVILYASVLSTAVAFTLQAIGQLYVPPGNAAIILSSESLFAALGGALLLGERLPPIGYVGAGLMFLAILAVETVPALVSRRRGVRDVAPSKIVN